MAEVSVICPTPKGEELIGQVFGKLRVIGFAGSIKRPGKVPVKRWLCVCACGNLSAPNQSAIKSGSTNSCGCVRAAHQWRCNFKHGLHGHPLYKVWQGMKSRCHNRKNISYKDYGGRGIFVSAEWRIDFMRFYSDMSPNYAKGLSIERIKNNLGYSKDNCRWATRIDQQNNLRRNAVLTVGLKTQTIAQWARETGIAASTLYRRAQAGWAPERVVSGLSYGNSGCRSDMPRHITKS